MNARQIMLAIWVVAATTVAGSALPCRAAAAQLQFETL